MTACYMIVTFNHAGTLKEYILMYKCEIFLQTVFRPASLKYGAQAGFFTLWVRAHEDEFMIELRPIVMQGSHSLLVGRL